MRKRIKNASVFMILFILCFSLIGCGVKSQGGPQSQDVIQNQEDVTKKDATLGDTVKGETIKAATDLGMLGNDVLGEENVEPANENTDEISEVQTEPGKEKNLIIFKMTSETVYATANVNVRSSYTTSEDNVISVLSKGGEVLRIGFQEEWSKVLFHNEVCYIKTNYLTLEKPDLEKPVAENIITKSPDVTQTGNTTEPSSDESFVAKLKITSKINQLVCVIGEGGSSSTVSFHKKDDQGKWHQQFSVAGDVGSKGITYDKIEGDKKSPAGLFSFTIAFGIKPDPGAMLSYRQITEYDYWIDDGNSPYYNTWVNSKDTPGDYSSEHLIDHNPSYNYVLNINYNPDCTKGLGSAIFLHGYNGSGRTTGCIAIPEKHMKTLVKAVDSSTKILIVPSSADLANY